MIKYIAAIALSLLTSSKVFAAFIYADDYALGQDSSHLTDNATLSWLAGTGNASSSYIFGPNGFYHQHFGGRTTAITYDVFPGIMNEILGSPVLQDYAALQVDFTTPVRSFGVKVENSTSSPFRAYLFGTDGSFLEMLTLDVTNTGAHRYESEFEGSIFDGTYNWNFDFDVSQIKIGGTSDAGFIYALDVTQVPEPSSLLLFLIGLACVVKVRHAAKVD